MENLPSINGAHPDQRIDLFLTKLKACEKQCDFSDPRVEFYLKETKRRHLVDIAEYVSSNKGVFNETTYKPFMRMISANVLRTLPQPASSDHYYEPEEDDPFLEPSWPHLQVVYELLRKFVVSSDTDSKLARASISLEFVTGIVELFNSEDPREREYLKTIMHRIYGKVMPLRAPIRACVMNVFHRVIYGGERFNGLAELLEILGSIINGFAIPLKEEHKDLLRKGLLPLHVPSSMPVYHVELCFCVAQFVEKDGKLAAEVVRFLLRHWPATHSRKEVLLLNEVEEILEIARAEDVGGVAKELFRRIGRCIASPHFQVAERALFYWNNEYVVSLMMEYREDVMDAVIGPLATNIGSHWNANVHSLSCNVQRLLCEMDAKVFEMSNERYERELVEGKRKDAERRARWREIYKIAQLRSGRRKARAEIEGINGKMDEGIRVVGRSDRFGNDRKGVAIDVNNNFNGLVGDVESMSIYREEHESDGIRKATRLVEAKNGGGGKREQEASC